MIFNYLVGLTFLVMSMVGFNFLFIKNDEVFNQQKKAFHEKTLSHLIKKNERGSISLVAACFCVVLSFFLLFLTTKYTFEFHEAKYRKESYLCFHYLNEETKDYVNEMSHFNKLLAAETAAMVVGVLVPGGTQAAKQAHNVTKKLRDARHFYYIKKILVNDYCEDLKITNDYFLNWPYKVTKLRTLVTRIDGSSIPREKKWKNNYYKVPSKKIRLRHSFVLQASFSMNNAYFPDLTIETQELLN